MPSKPDIKNLREAVEYSNRKLEPFRKNRLHALRQYVGIHYSDDGSSHKVPVNLLELAVGTYARHLAPVNLQVNVSTPHKQLKPKAKDFELAINHLIKEIQFVQTLRMAVIEGMFGMGVVKVGINPSPTVEVGGYFHDVGQPFADVIGLDDWVHDMSAKNYEQIAFCGNRYRMFKDDIEESELFPNTEAVKKLQKHDPMKYGRTLGSEDGAYTLSQGTGAFSEMFHDVVELIDLWLPRENLIVTLDADGHCQEPLRITEWDGPEGGPFRRLSFGDVPDNIMPLPPVANLIDLHELANELFRKIGRQGSREKEVLVYPMGATDDARRIKESDDGDIVHGDQEGKLYRFGGINNLTLAAFLQVRDLFSYLAGNLDALGGLSAQADTLGQERLITASASARANAMQERFIEFTSLIIRDLGWYLWTDPMINLPLVKRIPGVNSVEIPTTFSAENREGEFMDYNLQINPYSMQSHTPASKLQFIQTWLGQIMTPLLPFSTAAGGPIDLDALNRLGSELGNVPELLDVVVAAPSLDPAAQRGPVEPPRQAPVTTRNTVRTNVSGATRAGRDAETIKSLMSAGSSNNPKGY